MDDNPILNRDVAALVERLRIPTETTWTWHQQDDRHIEVYLIDASKLEHARRMIAIGLAGGEGRTLSFSCINGVWLQFDEGKWIG